MDAGEMAVRHPDPRFGKLGELIELVDADVTFPKSALQAARGLRDHCRALAESIETFEAEIVMTRKEVYHATGRIIASAEAAA
jgi:hypothetical protein